MIVIARVHAIVLCLVMCNWINATASWVSDWDGNHIVRCLMWANGMCMDWFPLMCVKATIEVISSDIHQTSTTSNKKDTNRSSDFRELNKPVALYVKFPLYYNRRLTPRNKRYTLQYSVYTTNQRHIWINYVSCLSFHFWLPTVWNIIIK